MDDTRAPGDEINEIDEILSRKYRANSVPTGLREAQGTTESGRMM
jgi:hypothetical protein